MVCRHRGLTGFLAAAAAAEWDAEFRSDIGAFLDDELIDAAIDHGRPLELSPVDGVI